MNNLTLVDLFLNEYWIEKGLSENTVQSYRLDLTALCDWLDKQNLSLETLEPLDLQQFLGSRLEQGYKATSTARMLSAMRKLFQYLYREKYRTDDPSAVLSSPKLPSRLPKYLTEQQVTDLLNTPDVEIPLELRDKAMLELLYATGLRVTELVTLTIENMNLQQGVVRVIGKGNKERIVYMGSSCRKAIDRYLIERSQIVLSDNRALFGSRDGNRISVSAVHRLVKKHLLAAGLDSTQFSAHKLRHTAATLMLSNGVDLKTLQEVLGHENLNTTQIYTHIESTELKIAAEANPLSHLALDGPDTKSEK